MEAWGRVAGDLTRQSVAALEQAVALNPLAANYHMKLAWEYTLLPPSEASAGEQTAAAERAMRRAAYFEGKANPWIHKEMGNFWLLRSKSLDPGGEAWRMFVLQAGEQYRTALYLVDEGSERKGMRKEIEAFIWNQYPGREFRERLLSEEWL